MARGAGKTTTVRVQARGRLVQEDDLGRDDQAGGQVQPAAHPARIRAGPAAGRVGQAELVQQGGGPGPRGTGGQAAQPARHDQVLGAGQQIVQRRVLPGQADPAADPGALGGDVVAGHPGPPAVRPGQRGQDPHRGGLARAVRPEEGEHAAPRDPQADPGQDLGGAVGLGQPGRLDGQPAAWSACPHDEGPFLQAAELLRNPYCVFTTLIRVRYTQLEGGVNRVTE
jgi:hypothetical protein